ncbi:MAG: two-component system sensor histidine kinase NtrB [Thermoplasmatota archaeon]
MLAGLLATIIPAAAFGSTIVPYFFDRTFSLAAYPSAIAGLASALLLIGPYFLSRTRHYRLAAYLTILIADGGVWAATYVARNTIDGVSPLMFVPVVILLAGQFLGARPSAWVGAANLAFFVPFVWVARDVRVNSLTSPFILIGMVVALVYVASAIRERDLDRIASSERRLRSVVRSAPILLTVIDHDGTILMTDGHALERMGLQPGVNVGRNMRDVYPDRSEVQGNIRRALAGETFTSTAEARGVVLETHWTPVHSPDGVPRGAIGVSIDVTDRMRDAAELEESRKQIQRAEQLSALGTLVAGVAHEVNNPLTFMKGNTELIEASLEALAQNPSLPGSIREAVAQAQRNASQVRKGIDRIQVITKSLKQVAKPAAGIRAAEDVNGLVDTVLVVAGPRIGPSIRVVRELGARRKALVNGNEIQQVLLNLALNATEAMTPQGSGTLTIRTFDRGNDVVVEVSDTGSGIKPEDQARIFTPFHTTKSSGTGLGLSVSLRIVEDHGGSLTFESYPAKGTTFRLTIPAAGDPSFGASPATTLAQATVRTKGTESGA